MKRNTMRERYSNHLLRTTPPFAASDVHLLLLVAAVLLQRRRWDITTMFESVPDPKDLAGNQLLVERLLHERMLHEQTNELAPRISSEGVDELIIFQLLVIIIFHLRLYT